MDQGRRQALLGAMIEELVLEGYQDASARRACGAAGVGEAEFAAEFGDKDSCLFAAYEEVTAQILAKATAACATEAPWPERIRAGLATLLTEFAARAQLAQAVTRSFPAIRPSAYERYVALLSLFTPFVREGREYCEVGEELPGEVELLAVGAAESIIFEEIDAGQAERLPGMLPEILFSVLVPFLGPDRAAEEMRTAAAAI